MKVRTFLWSNQIDRHTIEVTEVNLRDVCKKVEEDTGMKTRTVKKVVESFMDDMLNDMIMKNQEFVFPKRNTISIYIGYLQRSLKANSFSYNMNTDGKWYKPIIKYNQDMLDKMKRLICYMTLKGEYFKKLKNETSNGHYYSNR